jgi:hypothetical protein
LGFEDVFKRHVVSSLVLSLQNMRLVY